MQYHEPENLYPDYRKSFTEKLVPIIKQGVSFKIEGSSGVGKSKYLRYISSSETMHKKYFSEHHVALYYVDLNLAYRHDTDNVVQVLCDVLDEENYTTKGLENRIKKLLETNEKIYLIFDHAERLAELEESTIRFIRAIRDLFKYKLAYIISYEKENNLNVDKLKYINEIASITFTLGPLDQNETILNIKHFAELQETKLSDEDIKKIAVACKGFPKFIKQILMELLVQKSIDDAIRIVEKSTKEEVHSQEEGLLDTAIKNLTRGEFIIFRELYSSKGKVVTRDQLANLLNPDSYGEGVSDESIDQLVSRVRKALKKAKIEVEIKTRRGIGYYC